MSDMSRIKGKNMMLWTNASGTSKVVGAAISANIDIDCDMVEVTNFLSGRAKTFRAGRYSWTVSSDSLLQTGGDADSMAFLTKLKAGTELNMSIGVGSIVAPVPSPTEVNLSGKVIVKRISIGAPVAGNVSFKVDLQGSGELS